jgi:hypothetical protein
MEKRRLRIFENRMPSKIFGPKRDEVRGEWTRLHHEELYDLYSSPNKPSYYSRDKMMKNEKDGARGKYGGKESCIHRFDWET